MKAGGTIEVEANRVKVEIREPRRGDLEGDVEGGLERRGLGMMSCKAG